MSITLRPLTKHEANYFKVIDLYKRAFPGARRIPTWMLRYKLRNGKTGFNVVYSRGTWIGLIYITEHQDIAFMHFLAISESCRSVGYGIKVMNSIKDSHAGKRIVANIEELDEQATNYQQRMKRKSFYERCGFSSSGYLVKEPGEQLEMMISGGTISKEEIEEVYNNLFGGVLGFVLNPKVTRI
jgi:ribosomal protein S18 acetylase RimI-like enzyme